MITNYVHERYLDAEERYEIFVVKAAERPHLLHWSTSDSHKKIVEASAAEKVHGESDDGDDEKKDDDLQAPSSSELESLTQPPPPLTDGCDLPGWRCQRIGPCMNPTHQDNNDVDIESPLEGVLNIGASSTLLRRESLFPFISLHLCSGLVNSTHQPEQHVKTTHNNNFWWHAAKKRFNVPPPPGRAAPIIYHKDAARVVNHIASGKERNITVFCQEYEIKNRPVNIIGATEGWPSMPHYEKNYCDDVSEISNRWKDVGETSALFSGGGKGGWT